MDEKLRDTTRQIIVGYGEWVSHIKPNEVFDWGNHCAEEVEQAFRDAKWIEPQQPEGELITEEEALRAVDLWLFGHSERIISLNRGHWEDIIPVLCEAQLAHDKARMVKLPSEDEFRVMLKQAIEPTSAIMDFNGLAVHNAAHELLKLLGEKP